MAEGFKEKVPK